MKRFGESTDRLAYRLRRGRNPIGDGGRVHFGRGETPSSQATVRTGARAQSLCEARGRLEPSSDDDRMAGQVRRRPHRGSCEHDSRLAQAVVLGRGTRTARWRGHEPPRPGCLARLQVAHKPKVRARLTSDVLAVENSTTARGAGRDRWMANCKVKSRRKPS